MRFMKFVALLDGWNEALVCVCLQWATLGTGEEGDDVGREGEGRKLVTAGQWFAVTPS